MKIAGDYGQISLASKPFVAIAPPRRHTAPVPGRQVILFVKAPRAGFVKTRLAQTVGAQTALDAYRTLVEVITTRLAPLREVELRFAPADAEEEIRPWLADGWTCRPQSEGDLGQRLSQAFEQAFQQGNQRVIIIGSDCPYLTVEDIEDATRALDTADLVLGPATDGGYWLIGLSRPVPELFSQINWSTETVLEETMAKARAAGLKVHLLRELSDVDTLADLTRFHERSLTDRIQSD